MSTLLRRDISVFMAMPTYDMTAHLWAARAFYATPSRTLQLHYGEGARSLLANGFNMLWGMALNLRLHGERLTHFAMLHADVIPDDGWVDTLLAELEKHEAAMVSAVVPIKSPAGTTSTAIACKDPSVWEPERLLTLKECHALPKTFTAVDCGYPDRHLLVNTGCWLADLRHPCFADGPCFEIRDRMPRHAMGFKPECESEDWGFSRKVQQAGGKVMATTAVGVRHAGTYLFDSRQPWGLEIESRATTPLPIFAKQTQPAQEIGV